MTGFDTQLIPEAPPRALSPAEVEAFARQGAICIRGLYSEKWLSLAEQAVAAVLARTPVVDKNGLPDARFRSDAMAWHSVDAMRDFALYGPTAHIVGQALQSQALNFFGDQIFVKRDDTSLRTPWHHDITFFPLAGEQCASVWAPLDAVSRAGSSLEFVAGSHRWNERYWPVGVGGLVKSLDALAPPPAINQHRDNYDIIGWDLQPGDAVLFHARTLHSAKENLPTEMNRRALATRWCGDDVVFSSNGREMIIPWAHGLEEGARIGGAIFPQVLPRLDVASLAARARGPVLPDPLRLEALGVQARQFRVVDFD